MLTTLSIISRSQGQIHGEKPSLEEIERQLEADPVTRAVNRCVHMLTMVVPGLRRTRFLRVKPEQIPFEGVVAAKSATS
jgi:predicted metalloprotease